MKTARPWFILLPWFALLLLIIIIWLKKPGSKADHLEADDK